MRKPIYGITKTGLEFRCSYLLSGYSLAKLGEQLHKYKCEKLVGDLDYSLLRHSKTPLTQKEIGYCLNDIKVVMCYIQELIERYKGITKLPITKRDSCVNIAGLFVSKQKTTKRVKPCQILNTSIKYIA